jgi:hypothetical protein
LVVEPIARFMPNDSPGFTQDVWATTLSAGLVWLLADESEEFAGDDAEPFDAAFDEPFDSGRDAAEAAEAANAGPAAASTAKSSNGTTRSFARRIHGWTALAPVAPVGRAPPPRRDKLAT